MCVGVGGKCLFVLYSLWTETVSGGTFFNGFIVSLRVTLKVIAIVFIANNKGNNRD